MLNVEKYKNELMAMAEHEAEPALVNGKLIPCSGCDCRDCQFDDGNCISTMLKWLLSEYVEPKVDWSKVKVDTPILVSDNGEKWHKRYFADYYEDLAGRMVYVWNCGCTSWSTVGKDIIGYKYAKLAEDGE